MAILVVPPFAFLLQLHFGLHGSKNCFEHTKHSPKPAWLGLSLQRSLLAATLHGAPLLGGEWALPGAVWGSLWCLSLWPQALSLVKCSVGGWVGVDVCLWGTGVWRFPRIWVTSGGGQGSQVWPALWQLGNLATASEPSQPSGRLF